MFINFNQLNITYMPDGQPHIIINKDWINDKPIDIICSLVSTEDLFILGLLVDILRRKDSNRTINLSIHYLLGSRMDRPISDIEPNTLRVVCNYLNLLSVNIIVTFPHSSSILDRLNCRQNIYGEMNFIEDAIFSFIKNLNSNSIDLILPDSGSEKRFYNDHYGIIQSLKNKYNIMVKNVISCTKHRNMTTGKLSGFSVNSDKVSDNCIIIDDLCDAGGTFSGIAQELRIKGAKKISLGVYHGIFSKGFPIQGIDSIYTTNSFRNDLVSDKYITIKNVI